MRYEYSSPIWKPASVNIIQNTLSSHDLLQSIIKTKIITVCVFYWCTASPRLPVG